MMMLLQIVAMPIFGLAVLVGMARLERSVDAGRGFVEAFTWHRHPERP